MIDKSPVGDVAPHDNHKKELPVSPSSEITMCFSTQSLRGYISAPPR